jgi:hypothetical protein
MYVKLVYSWLFRDGYNVGNVVQFASWASKGYSLAYFILA